MNKPPAFLFYAADFLADEEVLLMSFAARGLYITLLCFAWREGSIPSNIDSIAKLCGSHSSAITELWAELENRFVVTDNKAARLVSRRMEIQRQALTNHKKERSLSGKKGAESRWNKGDKQIDNDDGSAIGSAIGSVKDLPMAKNGFSSSSSSSSIKEILTNVSTKKKGSRLPDQFFITPEMRDFAKAGFPQINITAETQKFCDHYRSVAGQRGIRIDWIATWRNWIREADSRKQSRQTSSFAKPESKPSTAPTINAAYMKQLRDEQEAIWNQETQKANA